MNEWEEVADAFETAMIQAEEIARRLLRLVKILSEGPEHPEYSDAMKEAAEWRDFEMPEHGA